MRIIYLHQYFNLPTDPGGTRSYEMAKKLVQAGHKVFMITSDHHGKFKERGWRVTMEDGIEVHWLSLLYNNKMSYSKRIKTFLKFAIKAAHRAAQIPAEVVFATSTPLTIAIPGVYASKRQKIPMVFEVRDLWPDVPIALNIIKNPILKKLSYLLEKFAYSNSAMIVALAPGMAKAIEKKGYPSKRLAIIPNGTDILLFQVKNNGMNYVVKKFPGISNHQVVIYAGAIGLANGVEYIPILASKIKRLDPNTRLKFIIIGDGVCKEKVENLSKKLGVLNQTVFLIGSIPKKEIPHWLASGSATLMTYSGPPILYRDSVSNKFFDSLAAGKPILANFEGFSTKIAEKFGVCKILDKDPCLAAQQLINLFNNPDWFKEAEKASIKLAKTFDRQELALKLETVLMSVVANKYPSEKIGKEFIELWQR